MPVTIYDIAKKVNLSHTTVSRVLNARTAINIPDATRSRVPNLNARALVMGRTKLIALQLFRMNSPFAMEVAQQMQVLAWQDGYEVLVHEFMGINTTLNMVVDGVFLLDRIYRPEDPTPRPEEQTPQVSLGAFHVETIDSVGVDLGSPSREAMQLLLRSGRKRIAFIGQYDPIQSTPDGRLLAYPDGRLSAYIESMQEAGLPTELLPASANTRFEGHRILSARIKEQKPPEAIFCANDELAVGCYRALRERGLRIPEDVALIGCDDIDEGKYLDPPLTTIAQPIEMLCKRGWEFLKCRIEDRNCAHQRELLPGMLTLRESHLSTGQKMKSPQN
jgi:DNA-binding LacI/PurR family transcriptional regulator